MSSYFITFFGPDLTLKTDSDDLKTHNNRFFLEKPYPNEYFEVDFASRSSSSDFLKNVTHFS